MTAFSKRVAQLPTYPMAELPAIKRRLIAQGVDLIDVGAGDADFAPPEVAVHALTRALQDPAMSRYAFQLGLPAFREAAAAYMHRRFGVTVDPFKELHPILGSKEGIAHLATAVLDPGDVAIVPVPGYAVYHGGTVLADGEPYLVDLTPRTDFLLELAEIPRDVRKRAKLIYLNYPNNPTAAVAPRDYLERTIAACREYDVLLAYDNPYCEITFDGYVAPSIFEIPGAMDVAVEFHSLSKSFCMTGWRLGWAVGRPDRIAALARVKNYIDTGAFLAVQAAGAEVLKQAERLAAGYVAQFKERRDAILPALRTTGFEVESPRATMYLWVPLPEGLASAAFQKRALEDVGVVTLPGSAFGAGAEGFFRIALTVATPRLLEAAERLGKVLAAV
ncbi:MAG TPA: aminotransferase class I/II-fold pyridoxal phosphate-dependent enzyme [Gemmatimonadales bacterium]|nr:aminotransferase class I/II-fold pyridoxal phosphate-dependent enzyme [Gemmatimonadales bacterium]